MHATQDLVREILSKSAAPLIVRRVQDALAEEQRKRSEFYEMIDEDMKAEFVNGEVFVHSPVVKEHNDVNLLLSNLLGNFARVFGLGYVGVEKILVKFTRNDYEPDICFFGKEKAKNFRKGQLLFPVPDLAVEVLSKSSQRIIDHDRVTKYDDYELHGVGEYWIVDPDRETVEQFFLEDGKYQLQLKSGEGVIRSRSVEGFSIPIRAIFNEKANLEALLDMLRQHLGTVPPAAGH